MYTLAQAAASIAHPVDPVRSYYLETWRRTPGYHAASPDWLEVPEWAAHVAGALKPTGEPIEFRTLHLTPPEEAALLHARKPAGVFGSVLDVNLDYWQRLVGLCWDIRFILGGYVPADSFAAYPNVTWLASPADIETAIPGAGPASPDYSLFAGVRCIPRLRLSTGCLHRCSFCTVPQQVIAEPFESVARQVDSFAPLQFELVYLDDKTFGQCDTAAWLPAIADRIRRYNPRFEGFIVQTTAPLARKHCRTWARWGVRYVEVGVETLEGEVLKQWHKPHGPGQIEACAYAIALAQAEGYRIQLIPNLIFGYENADYTPTLAWLRRWADICPFVNPYILCQYHDSKGTVATVTGGNDADEGSWNKAWLTGDDVARGQAALHYALSVHGG
jgi:hypothetical protein